MSGRGLICEKYFLLFDAYGITVSQNELTLGTVIGLLYGEVEKHVVYYIHTTHIQLWAKS